MTSSTLQEMTRLHLSRPADDAPAAVVAAWYERKALLLEHLAAEHTHGADDAARLAVQAQEHATWLMTRNPTPTGPDSAVRSAKTESAEPGLPGYESTRRGKNPMIRTTDSFAGLRPGGRVPHLSLHLPPEWVSDALCAQTDPEVFYPQVGGSVRPAKNVCRSCPVLAECRAYALANAEHYGVWGGLTSNERRRIRRQSRRTGTPVTELGRAAA